MMDKKLFEILACPLCKGDLRYQKDSPERENGLERQSSPESGSEPVNHELVCRPCGLAFPIRDDIPVMLENEARTLTTDERLEGGN